MKNALWISLPLSLLCLFAQANTITVATSAPPAPAAKAAAPAAPTATPGAATTTAVNTSVAAAPDKPEASSVKYSLGLSTEYSMQAQQQEDGSRAQSMNYMIKPGLSYGEYTVRVEEYFEQDLVDPKSTGTNSWTDPVVSVSKKAWTLSEYFKLSPSGSAVIPMKDATKNEVGLLYSVTGSLNLSLNTKTLGMDAWSFGYGLAATKSFTSFDTNAKNGNPSPSHRFRNRLTFGYQIMDKLSFFNLFDFNSNYSVNGIVTNSFFSLQSFGYDLTDNVSLSLSHTNGGSYLKAETYENNLKFFDEENSSYSLGLEVSI